VPFGFAPPLLPPLPPQEQSSKTSISGTNRALRRTRRGILRFVDRLLALTEGRTRSVMVAKAQSQVERDPGDRNIPRLRDVVVTLTEKLAGVLASTFSVRGTEQVAPFGKPVQLNEATPPIPLPPMESM
jgi:hypothetical protein